MRFNEIHLQNILSFGPETKPLKLENLNVFIGPNGSGKSNFLEVLNLLKWAPRELAKPMRESGGVSEWIWKGNVNANANLKAGLYLKWLDLTVQHSLVISAAEQVLIVEEEHIEKLEKPRMPKGAEKFFYRNWRFRIELTSSTGEKKRIKKDSTYVANSILARLRDPFDHQEISDIGDEYGRIRLFRDWSVGRTTQLRRPQAADQQNSFLSESLDNLGLILNVLANTPKTKKSILDHLRKLYPGIDDYNVHIQGNTVQIFLHEGDFTIPATRLSDGTLRYLCLLAILCHPDPPPVICIEEPEIGMHPDILPTIAELLKDASQRTQLFVTTHSDILVDALSDTPESVVVCEKVDGATQMTRLDKDELSVWLEKYRLGELWLRGDIGGTRW